MNKTNKKGWKEREGTEKEREETEKERRNRNDTLYGL